MKNIKQGCSAYDSQCKDPFIGRVLQTVLFRNHQKPLVRTIIFSVIATAKYERFSGTVLNTYIKTSFWYFLFLMISKAPGQYVVQGCLSV